MGYYDGCKLLSMMDINKCKPSIYIANTNRSAGKTTFYNRMLVNNWIKYGQQFILFYRFKKDLCDIPDKFFGEISGLFFPDSVMRQSGKKEQGYLKLILDDKVCGYAVALNASEDIKKCSHMFSGVQTTLLDEFQSETGNYVPDEISKYISIQQSIARGKGEQVRYIRNILCGNFISLLNPYYTALGVHRVLNPESRYTRGDGFVIETDFYKDVAEKSGESPFNRAFRNHGYNAMLQARKYLNDNTDCIRSLTNTKRYVCTMIGDNCSMGVWECDGYYTISSKYDNNYPIVCAKKSTPLMSKKIRAQGIFDSIRALFDTGNLYFDSISVKNDAISILGY